MVSSNFLKTEEEIYYEYMMSSWNMVSGKMLGKLFFTVTAKLHVAWVAMCAASSLPLP